MQRFIVLAADGSAHLVQRANLTWETLTAKQSYIDCDQWLRDRNMEMTRQGFILDRATIERHADGYMVKAIYVEN